MDVFLLPDPLRASGQVSELKFERFVELMKSPQDKPIYIPYDNFFTMSGGMIARHISNNDAYRLNLTWRHYKTGFSIISCPLSSATVEACMDGWLHGYDQEQQMLASLQLGQNTDSFIVDVNQLIWLMLAVFVQHRQLMKEGKIKGPLYAKAVLHNIWRRIPFLDTPAYIRFISECGLPVIQATDASAPFGQTYEDLLLIPDSEEESDRQLRPVDEGALLIRYILDALGLPGKIIRDDEEHSWVHTQERTPKVNELRSRRGWD